MTDIGLARHPAKARVAREAVALGRIEMLHGAHCRGYLSHLYCGMSAVLAIIPSSVIRYVRSLFVPCASIQPFWSNVPINLVDGGNSDAFTQPRPRSRCINCRSK